jgi:hypothetical protein
MVELKIYYDGVNYDVDVDGVLSFPLSYAVADIANPDKRNTSYSKTVSIIGTQKNNKIFQHIFEISGESDWNVNKKVRCAVYQNGSLLFDGFIRVANIVRKLNGVTNYMDVVYECNVFGELGDFIKSLGKSKIEDLDFSEYDHDYTYDNVVASWIFENYVNAAYTDMVGKTLIAVEVPLNENGLVKYNVASHGLSVGQPLLITHNGTTNRNYTGTFEVVEVVDANNFTVNCPYGILTSSTSRIFTIVPAGEGYVYPMIDYGSSNGNTWKVTDFSPALFLRQYLRKIFDSAGRDWDSDFFDSDYFKTLVVPFNGVSVELTQEQIDDTLFRASRSTDVVVSGETLGSGPYYNNYEIASVVWDDDSTSPNYDNNGVYSTAFGEYTAPYAARYSYKINARVKVDLSADPAAGGYTNQGGIARAVIIVLNNGTPIGSFIQPLGFGGGSSFTAHINTTTPEYLLQAGDVVTWQLYTEFVNVAFYNGSFAQYTGAITYDSTLLAGSYTEAIVTNAAIIEGGLMPINNAIPKDILQADLFMWVVRKFNLYVDADKNNDKVLRIEPRDEYYRNNTALDWTSKLDISSDINLVPIGEMSAKEFIFKDTDDKDLFNEDHVKVWGETYGQQRIEVDNDFVDGEKVIECGFSPTVLHDYPVGSDRIISTIQGNGFITQNRIASNLRLLHYSYRGTDNVYTIQSNLSGNISRYVYGYAGHLDNPAYPLHDLNFGFPKGTYYNYTAWTDNNAYNKYYKNQIEEVTDRHGKIMRAYFHLNDKDICTLDFRNYIRVDNHLFRLNKITDYDPVVRGLTLCELIKVKNIVQFVARSAGGSGFNPTDKDIFDADLPKERGASPDKTIFTDEATNTKMGDNSGTIVRGLDNQIGYGVKNSIIVGNNNVIDNNLENVIIIGTDGVTVTESNTTIINGVRIFGDSSWVTITSTTVVDNSQSKILVDTTGGNIKINLPIPSESKGVEFVVKRITAGVNDLDVGCVDGSAITDGAIAVTMPNQYDCLTFSSDGSNYHVIF